jgi:hypothetical protein
MVTYNLATPFTIPSSSLSTFITVTSLVIARVYYSNTPDMAPIGASDLEVTVKDPVSGWVYNADHPFVYQDTTVSEAWSTPLTLADGQTTVVPGDLIDTILFSKLAADGKIPAGQISVT